jgi:mono/diheme cytochrome c family protein
VKRPTEYVLVIVVVLVTIAIGFGVYAMSGLYDMGADNHHWTVTYKLLQTVRDRSVRMRSKDLRPPSLNDPQLVLKGAGQYEAMCTGCHLAPGKENSEVREGMYPQPPNLSKFRVDPRAAFWVIKHGIKMSGMPAWGGSHDDATIWSMVAFLQRLPQLTPQQYKDIVSKAPPDEDMDMDSRKGHTHARGTTQDEGRAQPAPGMSAMPGMATSAPPGST